MSEKDWTYLASEAFSIACVIGLLALLRWLGTAGEREPLPEDNHERRPKNHRPKDGSKVSGG